MKCPLTDLICNNLKINLYDNGHICNDCVPFLSMKIDESKQSEFNNLVGNHPGKCPSCNTTLEQIKSTGLLGCPSCYGYFSRKLLLPSNNYISYSELQSSVIADKCWSVLQDKLADAIAKKDTELAGELRDKIETLSPLKKEKEILDKKLEIAIKDGNTEDARNIKLMILALVDQFMRKL